jgi:eukaryotic-like serine/threonine-protein kinase
MRLKTRVWGAGKTVAIIFALLVTYAVFAVGSARLALRAREVKVPDLTDRTASEATTVAADLGLLVKVDETRRPDPKIAAGRVFAQDPAPGSISRSRRSVKVWLSAGQRAASVPALVGESEREAQLRLAQDGLAVSGISEIRSLDHAPDAVVAQSPPAAAAGASVALLVNRRDREASYVMPDIIGVNGERAAEVLRSHGFRVAVVASNTYPGVPPGIVLRQSPQGGFQISAGEPISLEVSR